jgi:hypothetical protein
LLESGIPSALALLGGLAFLVGLILFGAATMRGLAVVFVVIVVINAALMYVWGQ